MPASRSHSSTPAAGHFAWRSGQCLLSRYRVLGLIGDGTFGRVLRVQDCSDPSRLLALKVVRPLLRYTEAAQYEATLLRFLQSFPEFADAHVVRLIHHFPLDQHYCLVYELLGPTLYDELKRREFAGLSLGKIQAVARDLLRALSFLHAHGIAHTDLKLENVSFSDSGCSTVKVIDFGSATRLDAPIDALISTRQYRAPEVLLGTLYAGLAWDEKSDIWSLACVCAELFTGTLLFPTHENYEHLAMVEKMSGRIPTDMARRAKCAGYFDARGRLTFPRDATLEQVEAVKTLRTIDQLVPPRDREFRYFLRLMLEIDPKKRPSAKDLARSPFFARVYA